MPLLHVYSSMVASTEENAFKLLMITYKIVHDEAPHFYLTLCQYKPARPLRCADNYFLVVVRTHVRAGDIAFAVAATSVLCYLHHYNIRPAV